MTSPVSPHPNIKIYTNKPGFHEIRFRVGTEKRREVIATPKVGARVDEILVLLNRCLAPLTPEEIATYHAARLILPENITLLDAIRGYLETSQSAKPWGVTPSNWGSYATAYRASEGLRGVESQTVSARINLVNRLVVYPEHRCLNSTNLETIISREWVESFLACVDCPSTYNSQRAILKGFFDWVQVHPTLPGDPSPNHKNPTSFIHPLVSIKPRKVEAKDPVPFTPDELTKIFVGLWKPEGAEESTRQQDLRRQACLFLALGAFAGIRRSEIGGLRSTHTHEKGITLGSDITKTGRRRLVQIHPTLKSWMDLTGGFSEVSGFLLPHSEQVFDIIREAATKAGVEWKSNGLRKGFVSYSTELYGVTATAKQAGHSEAVLERHYKALVTSEAAEQWFAITPALIHRLASK